MTNTIQEVYEGADRPYDVFLRNTDQKWLIAKMMDKELEYNPRKRLHVNDFGCSSGDLSMKLLDVFEKKGYDIEYAGYDPSDEQLNKFRQRLGDRKETYLINNKLENLAKADEHTLNTGKSDLAIASHCLYYVSELELSLRYLIKAF